MALLLPALSQAKELAKRSLCTSNMKQMSLAINGYANDFNGWLPPHGQSDTGAYLWWNQNCWTSSLYPSLSLLFPDYSASSSVFFCSGWREAKPRLSLDQIIKGGWGTPGDNWAGVGPAWSYWYYGGYLGTATPNGSPDGSSYENAYRITSNTGLCILSDQGFSNQPGNTWYTTPWPGHAKSGGFPTAGENALYIDGSASWVPRNKLTDMGDGTLFAPRIWYERSTGRFSPNP